MAFRSVHNIMMQTVHRVTCSLDTYTYMLDIMDIVRHVSTVCVKKKLSIPPCFTTVDIVWSRPLCDHCVTVAGLSLNRSISAGGLHKRDGRRYTIIACVAATSHKRGTAVLIHAAVVRGLSSPRPTRHMQT